MLAFAGNIIYYYFCNCFIHGKTLLLVNISTIRYWKLYKVFIFKSKFRSKLTKLLYLLDDMPPTSGYVRAHDNSLPEVLRRADKKQTLSSPDPPNLIEVSKYLCHADMYQDNISLRLDSLLPNPILTYM